MYRAGRGVAKDDAEAAEWFRKAAENGHEPARAALMAIYEPQ
jgi:TPR repeat protein